MFELKISNLSDAVNLSKKWATHTVSLLNPDIDEDYEFITLPIASRDRKLQRYYFHDVIPNDVWSEFFFNTEVKVATHEQIQAILVFTKTLISSDKLLVHCHAGISRSTAVACGILCQHGLTPKEAVKHMLSVRKQAFPNQHILKLFDDILGLEGQLVTANTQNIVLDYLSVF